MLVNALRAAHLVGVVGVGAMLLAGSPRSEALPFGALLIVSGAAIMAIDAWAVEAYFARGKGLGAMLKLALAGWMLADADHALDLFWLTLILSSLLSHAPGRVRNRRWVGTDERAGGAAD